MQGAYFFKTVSNGTEDQYRKRKSEQKILHNKMFGF